MSGTRTDFGTVFDRHAEQIYRYCARRIGPDAVADAVDDTFVIAYERRGRFDASQAGRTGPPRPAPRQVLLTPW